MSLVQNNCIDVGAKLAGPAGYENVSYGDYRGHLNIKCGYQDQIDTCIQKIQSLEKTVADLVDANNKLIENMNMLMYHPFFGDKLIGAKADFYLQESLRRRSN
jgi:hypothetical protein